MKSARRKAKLEPEGTITGRNMLVFPDIPQMMVGAVDTQNVRPSVSPVYTNNDILLYVFTPLRIRIDRPGAVWVTCDADTAILIPALSLYEIDTTVVPRGNHHCWLVFQGLYKHPLYQCVQNDWGMAFFRDPDGEVGRRIAEVVTRIEREWVTAFWPVQYQGRSVLTLLTGATRTDVGFYQVRSNLRKQDAPLTVRVVDYLQKHLSEPLDLLAIARAVHVSKSTLTHSYKTETGEPPLHTLRRMRIHRVKSLLLDNLSLTAIAEMTGFYDAHHVSREFRRTEGITPTAFRELTMARIKAGNRRLRLAKVARLPDSEPGKSPVT